MSKTKIAYLPVLNFNDPADLCSRLLAAEFDMMEEGLTIFHQEDYRSVLKRTARMKSDCCLGRTTRTW